MSVQDFLGIDQCQIRIDLGLRPDVAARHIRQTRLSMTSRTGVDALQASCDVARSSNEYWIRNSGCRKPRSMALNSGAVVLQTLARRRRQGRVRNSEYRNSAADRGRDARCFTGSGAALGRKPRGDATTRPALRSPPNIAPARAFPAQAEPFVAPSPLDGGGSLRCDSHCSDTALVLTPTTKLRPLPTRHIAGSARRRSNAPGLPEAFGGGELTSCPTDR